MVNIVVIAEAILKMHIIIDRCKDILFSNVFWNQVVDIPSDQIL